MDNWNEMRLRAWMGRLKAEQAGMEAENKQRELRGESIAYMDNEFHKLVQEWDQIAGQIRELG